MIDALIAGGVFLISMLMTMRLAHPSSSIVVADVPNERTLHEKPTSRTGGLAIVTALAAGALAELALRPVNLRTIVVVALPVALAAGVSFLDDWKKLSPLVRMLLHLVAASLFVIGSGAALRSVEIPSVATIPLSSAAIPLSIIGMVWLTNLYNFMDGMDGFAGGMAVIGFGALSLISGYRGHDRLAVFCLLVACAAGGFLTQNFPPAKIFMGDGGAIPLGFLAGVAALTGISRGAFDAWVPLLVFSPFVVDATVTLLKRLAKREAVWKPHRNHYYQKLVLSGWSHRKTVLGEYVIMLAAAWSALLYGRIDASRRLVMLVSWLVVYALLAALIHVKEARRQRAV